MIWRWSQWNSQPNPVYLKDGWGCRRGLCFLTVDAVHSLWSLVVTQCVPVENGPNLLHQNTKRCVKIGKKCATFFRHVVGPPGEMVYFLNFHTLNSIFFFSVLYVTAWYSTVAQGSYPFPHLSQSDILSCYQYFSKSLVSAIAPLLSSGLLHFLTRCTFILSAPSACSPRAQLPSKYTEILSPAEVMLQRSQRTIYRPTKFPAYLPLH